MLSSIYNLENSVLIILARRNLFMTKHYCKSCMGFTGEPLKCEHCGKEEIVAIEIFNHKQEQ